MERKIGETFEYEGHKLKLVDRDNSKCKGRFFNKRDCMTTRDVIGSCSKDYRTDKKNLIFVEVKDEQPQEQAEQPKLNLCEILKYCPQGETFWSPMFDNVTLVDIDQEAKNIKVLTKSQYSWNINNDGTITIDKVTSPEIMLYPSRKQRDWSKFTAPWLKKERFNPKTLNAFDKVLARNNSHHIWTARVFSHIDSHPQHKYICGNDHYKICIPYNDDTKHLVGTADEAPEFYRYWEDY